MPPLPRQFEPTHFCIILDHIFSKKTFPSAQVLISSEIYKDFCKIPHLAITGHTPLPRFDCILKSVLKQFKKKYKTFALHPNLCPSNHTNQQTWNNANLLKKSSQNGLSSMKVHGFQAKWPKLQLISNDSFPK